MGFWKRLFRREEKEEGSEELQSHLAFYYTICPTETLRASHRQKRAATLAKRFFDDRLVFDEDAYIKKNVLDQEWRNWKGENDYLFPGDEEKRTGCSTLVSGLCRLFPSKIRRAAKQANHRRVACYWGIRFR